MYRQALALLVLAMGHGCGDLLRNPVDPNNLPRMESFPASRMPSLDRHLLDELRSTPPGEFKDYRIVKLAVVSGWGPWFVQAGVQRQTLQATVGVFDPKQARCWVWLEVYFFRQREGARPRHSHTGLGLNRIECSQITE
jgi:hypothetical protein